MSRRTFLTVAAGVAVTLAVGCASKSPQEEAAKRREIDARADAALTRLYTQAPGSREQAEKARGVLVFPAVAAGGLVVGGEYGEGSLRVANRTVDYYKMASASIGLTAGAQSKAVILMFMTQDALDKFRASKGWTAGVDASVAAMKVGADAGVGTMTAQAPVIAYVSTNSGLMADVSVQGSKISKLE
ncbi:MAG: hypothetical protein EOP82_15945 [Variovorax sp.]|nr:MAG: hypothetical protein EOP82_15945 [Variovorax sp.]